MAQRGNYGRGSRGACGGTRRRDGSGRGVGNRGTNRQPASGSGGSGRRGGGGMFGRSY